MKKWSQWWKRVKTLVPMDQEPKFARCAEKKDNMWRLETTLKHTTWKEFRCLAMSVKRRSGQELHWGSTNVKTLKLTGQRFNWWREFTFSGQDILWGITKQWCIKVKIEPGLFWFNYCDYIGVDKRLAVLLCLWKDIQVKNEIEEAHMHLCKLTDSNDELHF